MRPIIALTALLALAACGQKAELKPIADKQLPPAPYGNDTRKSAGELLAPPIQAAPERNVELRKRSEERADDPFDLPPRE